MLKPLKLREAEGKRIKVGLVGAGAMGMGIAYQLSITPGMQLSWVFDLNKEAAQKAADFDSATKVLDSVEGAFDELDVFVESSNSIQSALAYCEAAIQSHSHVVLMNAEVDLAFGPYLKDLADQHGVCMTSDAGDQHGVLAKMIEEISLWGFEVIQAGNIKGFLNRYATADDLLEEARIRNLNPIQCCAYTDGSKLSIEMAVLANAYGFLPTQAGMEGPKASSVEQALELFDFDNYPKSGVIDYILGANPGGGVYIIGKCDNAFQMPYLKYYKLEFSKKGNYYLFYRPYHLCHLETPQAIYKAVEHKEALLEPWAGRITEVYAHAKADFPAGTVIEEAIGSEHVYGMVGRVSENKNKLPQVVLECEGQKPVLLRDVKKDEILSFDDVTWPDRTLVDKYLLAVNQPSA